MEQKRTFPTSGPIWEEYFPKMRFWTISSAVVILVSFIILNCICSLYSEWTRYHTDQGFLGISHVIIVCVAVIGVVALLMIKDGNRVVAATGTIMLNSIIAIWQIWYFVAQIGGHTSYYEELWLRVLAAETVIQVVCCIMEVLSCRKIMGAHDINDET